MPDWVTRGRAFYEACAWRDAFEALSRADEGESLAASDLERLARTAYMVGRDAEHLGALERAHRVHREVGDARAAARCAFWLGFHLMMRGEMGQANGWLARARRILERFGHTCVEQGYLALPQIELDLDAGKGEAALDAAGKAMAIGDRFADPDLIACALHQQGRALLLLGRIDGGLGLLDEAMVSVTAGEVSPIVSGLLYCSVIDACQQVYAVGRAREWTRAMGVWCADQPQMVAFGRTCLVHQAEVLQFHGAWNEAFDRTRSACERSAQGAPEDPPAAAFYQRGELHRLRGELDAAEAAYSQANALGYEPQPGLALLRLAQGRTPAALAGIRRVERSTAHPLRRIRLLPAYIEILVAAGELTLARSACGEFDAAAASCDGGVLAAMAAQARGMVALAGGDAEEADVALRAARDAWQARDVPYLAARTRELIGVACRVLGDTDGSRLEIEAARATFERLGAALDLARVEAEAGDDDSKPSHGLTPREVEVLKLVAAGETNRRIAELLGVSERTVDRHVSNLFDKLDVSARTAAAAWAYENGIL